MLRSMTGYGRGEASNGNVVVSVELRGVNHRFLDIVPRLPKEYAAFENRVVQAIREQCARGRIEVVVRRESEEKKNRISIDFVLLEQLREIVDQVSTTLGMQQNQVGLDFYVRFPGVIGGESPPDATSEWAIGEVALQAAVSDFFAMRLQEGEALSSDIERILNEMEATLQQLITDSEGVEQRMYAKLSSRMARWANDAVEPARIAQEVAILAEKSDVSEEIARLKSHFSQARQVLSVQEPVGRKLDFLCQEIHREINTLGSKSAEVAMTQHVLELKALLERVREQAANVE